MVSTTRRNKPFVQNGARAEILAAENCASVADGARAVDGLGLAMGRIATSSDEVGKILKTIDSIAFQTNPLALNAAVEAARAGEAGRLWGGRCGEPRPAAID